MQCNKSIIIPSGTINADATTVIRVPGDLKEDAIVIGPCASVPEECIRKAYAIPVLYDHISSSYRKKKESQKHRPSVRNVQSQNPLIHQSYEDRLIYDSEDEEYLFIAGHSLLNRTPDKYYNRLRGYNTNPNLPAFYNALPLDIFKTENGFKKLGSRKITFGKETSYGLQNNAELFTRYNIGTQVPIKTNSRYCRKFSNKTVDFSQIFPDDEIYSELEEEDETLPCSIESNTEFTDVYFTDNCEDRHRFTSVCYPDPEPELTESQERFMSLYLNEPKINLSEDTQIEDNFEYQRATEKFSPSNMSKSHNDISNIKHENSVFNNEVNTDFDLSVPLKKRWFKSSLKKAKMNEK